MEEMNVPCVAAMELLSCGQCICTYKVVTHLWYYCFMLMNGGGGGVALPVWSQCTVLSCEPLTSSHVHVY